MAKHVFIHRHVGGGRNDELIDVLSFMAERHWGSLARAAIACIESSSVYRMHLAKYRRERGEAPPAEAQAAVERHSTGRKRRRGPKGGNAAK